MKWTVPNILTILRLLLVGVFLYLFLGAENYVAAVVVYCVAAGTDVVDGYIARHYNQITDFGKVMDPLADKLMLISALLCLTISGWIPPVFLILVLIRDVALVVGAAFLFKKHVVVYARIWGKLSTLFFNAGIVLAFLKNFVPEFSPFDLVALGLAVAFAVPAMVQYGKTFLESRRAIREGRDVDDIAGAGEAVDEPIFKEDAKEEEQGLKNEK